VATSVRRCGVGAVDRGIVLGIAFSRWIDGAGLSESVDTLDPAEERLYEDGARTRAAIVTI
jgi:hypothetical protein